MSEKETIKSELKEIAPQLLPAYPTPYQVPGNYFDTLPTTLLRKIQQQHTNEATPVFSLPTRNWKILAAAASITGLLFFSMYFYTNTHQPEGSTDITKWVKKEMPNLSEESLSDFIQTHESVPSSTPTVASTDKKELAQLVKDISNEELSSFLNEIPTDNP